MFRHFRSKSDKCLKASRMYMFEVKRNPKTPEDVKLSALQNGYFGFLNSTSLTPQTQYFDLSKINVYKIRNFGFIKNEIYAKNLNANNTQIKIQSNIFIFLCNGKKQIELMASLL